MPHSPWKGVSELLKFVLLIKKLSWKHILPWIFCAVLAVCLVLLSVRVAALKNENLSLMRENAEQEAQVNTLTTEKEELTKQNSELSEQISTLENAEASFGFEGAAEKQNTDSTDSAAQDFISIDDVTAGTILSEEQVDRNTLDRYFRAYEISDEIFARIYGDDRSYKTYCTVAREDLRYIKLLHYSFDGQIHVGELMVNASIADDILQIFRELFENQYQIEKMFLVDDYDADDDRSVRDNNTSCFNFRYITGSSSELSNHAYGLAIDINPQQNPYFVISGGEYHIANPGDEAYVDRTNPSWQEMHMITEEDLCYRLFTEHGFSWGGSWSNPIDYQHFERV